jgi:phage terminase large subunit GpA-like protein
LFLTAGVDVQADRIEMSVWGWGREKESWLIEHRVLDGDTSRREVWHSLSYVLNEYWPHESGVELSLRRLAIDSGYATQEVYGWARKQAKAQVMVVKGVQRGAALVGLATAVETTIDGKKLKRGIRVRPVVGGLAKLELFNNLRKNPPTIESGDPYPAGYVHLPKVDEEYLRQLCSEQLVTTKNRRGYPVREWQKTRERNEALDCYVYARAAAAVEGLDRFSERHWREMERSLGLDEPTKTQTTVDETETGKPASHSKRRRVRSRGVKI